MNSTSILKICVTASALVLSAVHQWTPLKLDTPTTVLLVVAVLPWLQPLVKSVELLGVKLELQDLQEKIAVASGAAESAKQQAFLAQSAVESTGAVNVGSLTALADEYDRIRDTQTPGDARTLAMTAVVHKIIELAPQSQDFNLMKALTDRRRGIRLVAYALLYAAPKPDHLAALIQSVTTIEDKPFGQYWGLQAIARNIDAVPSLNSLPSDATMQLARFAARIPRGTDRDYELRKILKRLQGKAYSF